MELDRTQNDPSFLIFISARRSTLGLMGSLRPSSSLVIVYRSSNKESVYWLYSSVCPGPAGPYIWRPTLHCLLILYDSQGLSLSGGTQVIITTVRDDIKNEGCNWDFRQAFKRPTILCWGLMRGLGRATQLTGCYIWRGAIAFVER